MIVTHALAWAQAITIQVVLDVVQQMHQRAVEQGARCIFITFILAVLTFIRANARVTISMHDFFTSISDGSTHMQGMLVGIVSALVEVAFFTLAIYLLDQAVSLSFFLFETCADFVPDSEPL